MVKEVHLNNGEAVLVDDEDYPVVSRYSWRRISQKGYAGTTIQFEDGTYRTLYLHQLILATNRQMDHKNQNHNDYQKENLRVATNQQNGWNKGKPKRKSGCSSQFKGVQFAPLRGKPRWVVLIPIGKKGDPDKYVERVGYFWDEIEAARAYNRRVVELRGEFAWVNPIPGENENPVESVG